MTLNSDEKLAIWKERGFTESKRIPCLHLVARVKCPRKPTELAIRDGRCMPRCADHTSVWNKNGRVAAIVTQPYHLYEDDLSEIYDFCKTLGITVSVSTEWNWHYHGTVSLVFEKEAM